MLNIKKAKKITTNFGALALALLCLIQAAPAEAELFSSSEHEKCKNDKLACELQIKYCRKKNKSLKEKIRALEECREEKSGLEETVGQRENEIKKLEADRELAKRKCEKDKAITANNTRELEQAINILRRESSVQEKDLSEEKKQLKKKHKAKLNEMARKLEEERNNHILETGAMRKDCEAGMAALKKTVSRMTLDMKNKNRKLSSLEKKVKSPSCPAPKPPPGLKLLRVQEKKLKKVLEKEIKNGEIRVIRFDDKLVINIDNGFCFIAGSIMIKKEAFPVFKKIGRVLGAYPKNAVTVEGHSDSDKLKSSIYRDNWELSAQRALSALRQILKKTDLDRSRFAAVGHGAHKPLAPNNSAQNKALNRRVEVAITPF